MQLAFLNGFSSDVHWTLIRAWHPSGEVFIQRIERKSNRVTSTIVVLLAAVLLVGEWVAGKLGYIFPNWLHRMSGLVEIIAGVILIVGILPLLRKRGLK